MAGFEPTTTTPQCSALPDCATSRKSTIIFNISLLNFFNKGDMKLIFIFILSIFIHNNVFASASDNLVVNTSSGDVHGKKYKNIFILRIFHAKPPIGNLRWKAPRELDSPAIISPKRIIFAFKDPQI